MDLGGACSIVSRPQNVDGDRRSSVPRTTVSASVRGAGARRARRTARRPLDLAAAGRDDQVAALEAGARRPGCRPRRRAPARRRARAGPRRGAAAAPRGAARLRRRGARAAPRRGRARRRARAARASAAIARISPPSTRTVLRPSSRPRASTSGPPEEPRGSGAVCSIAPAMRRPRGPRKLRAAEETKPGVTRRPRPPGLASASTACRSRRLAASPGPLDRRRPRRCRPRARRGRGRASDPATLAGLRRVRRRR